MMSDEALNVHMDLLDKALEQGEDYETWLERKVTHLEQVNAGLVEVLERIKELEHMFPDDIRFLTTEAIRKAKEK